MAENLDPKEVVTFGELLMSNMYTQEALINLLVMNGIITKEEVMEEIKMLKIEGAKHNRRGDQEVFQLNLAS